MDVMTIIGLISSLLGIITGIGYFLDKYQARKSTDIGTPAFSIFKIHFYARLKWSHAQKAARSIAGKILANKQSYDLIIGIGRGGAIFGSMLSYCLHQIPVISIDRVYNWDSSGRSERMLIRPIISSEDYPRVLLVAGESHSGNTIYMFSEYFKEILGKSPDVCAFYKQDGCTIEIPYVGLEGKSFKLMPWQGNDHIRDSRSKHEHKRLIDAKSQLHQAK